MKTIEKYLSAAVGALAGFASVAFMSIIAGALGLPTSLVPVVLLISAGIGAAVGWHYYKAIR